jgi:L-lactate dehydrogenase (cytochrome)
VRLGSSIEQCHNLHDVRAAARRRLPRPLFDFVDGGADDEVTLRRNRHAFSEITFRPRMAVDVPDPSLETTVVGSEIAVPVLLAPCGLTRAVHPDGEAGVARAAEACGTIAVLSTASGTRLETVAAASAASAQWFQLYFFGGRAGAADLVRRAQAAGFTTLVVTVDSAVAGNRERDVRNRLQHTLGLNLTGAVAMGPHLLRHPRWFYGFARDGFPLGMANLSEQPSGGMDPKHIATTHALTQPTWVDVEWVRRLWPGAMLVKGVTTAADARRAVDLGADGVVVSNHGGRQLDGLPASIWSLREVVDELGAGAEVLLDSGIRRGSDIAKALAVGARAVLIGRPYVFGLAVDGAAGVAHVIEILSAELRRTLRLLGCAAVADLDRSWLELPSVDHGIEAVRAWNP